ncbi:hypothetical protein NS220_05165 [Microbacterium testaceum]|uniref:Uncharacterized protein n=1 Tax=Microbacterium testaceum TaxID=2033 RepID=A0A147EZ67_MICTE|nr:hypothetical protein NS220_05165 [Microbacterium testaceum]
MTPEDWSSAVGALRFAYEVAVREGFEPVRADIRTALDSVTDHKLETLVDLIQDDSAVATRIAGTRERDGILPNLVGSALSLDLRAIDLSDDDDLQLAPIVTVRLMFDEHVAGQDAIVFQTQLTALEEIAAEAKRISIRIKRLEADLPTATVPPWAKSSPQQNEPAE